LADRPPAASPLGHTIYPGARDPSWGEKAAKTVAAVATVNVASHDGGLGASQPANPDHRTLTATPSLCFNDLLRSR
jgi:hypothetical protein